MAYTADEIGNRTFAIARRGYDRGEVEAFLREVARQRRADGGSGELPGELLSAESAHRDTSVLAERDAILEQARSEAAAIRADAESWAASVRATPSTSAATAATAGIAGAAVAESASGSRDVAIDFTAERDALASERAALAEATATLHAEVQNLASERQALSGLAQRESDAADRLEDVAHRMEVASADLQSHPSASAAAPVVPPPVVSVPPPASIAVMADDAPSTEAASSLVRSSVRDTPPVVHRAPGAPAEPTPFPDAAAPTDGIPSVPAGSEEDPADALGRVNNLLDGVVDDVMGNLRPES